MHHQSAADAVHVATNHSSRRSYDVVDDTQQMLELAITTIQRLKLENQHLTLENRHLSQRFQALEWQRLM